METAWDSEIADFLQHLSAVQQETLDMLVRKRELLARTDAQGLAALGGEEEGHLGPNHCGSAGSACRSRRKHLW